MSFLITITLQIKMKKKIQFKIHKPIYADSVPKTEQKIIIH